MRALSETEPRSAFLAEASRTLAASLDYETTLATVAALALPHLGAWCIVDVVEPDGSFRRLAVVHPDPARQALARRLEQGWPPEREDPIGAPAALRSRRSELIPSVPDDMLVGVARNEENLGVLRELGIGSLMVVPLIARDRVLGAITFVSSNQGDPYTDADLAMAEDLASRAALAIDNARLYAEAKSARAEAEAANLAKSQFLAMTSHEIRTPINAIIGYTDLLGMGIYGPMSDEQRQQMERIQASAQHLLGLVDGVLDLARVESGQMTVRAEKGTVAEAVEGAYTLVHPQFVAAGISLESRCAAGEGVAYVGDTDRVRQVLVNLLSNACKFTPSSGRVVVSCGYAPEGDPEARLSGVGPWACVVVEDTGIGIPADRLDRIFDPFVQVDQGLTRARGGSGLGLAISRQLARMMGGDLTVQSELGRGARFTLWLPPGENVERPAAAEPVARRSLAGHAARLLDRRDALLRPYVERLRSDPGVARGAEASEMMLQNHAVTFISGLAQHLSALAEGDATAAAMARDTAKVQDTVAALHGAQRRRMGWSEAALRRDWHILREEAEREIRGGDPHGDDEARALMVFARLFDGAERASVRAWHRAEESPG